MAKQHPSSLSSELTASIRPGDDFYNYVNAKWLAAHPIPDDKSRLGAFTEISDDNLDRLHMLLQKRPTVDDALTGKLAKQFYRAAMDEATIAQQDLAPVQPLLDGIAQITDPNGVAKWITQQHAAGCGVVWGGGLDVDEKDCTQYVFRMGQGGLGLPDRDYYLEDNERFEQIRGKYRDFLVELFKLLGQADPGQGAQDVLDIETALAKLSSTATERRDVVAQYNPYEPTALTAAFPGFDWPDYLKQIGYTLQRPVLVSQPKFLAGAIQLFVARPAACWRHYFAFHALVSLMPALPKPYELLHFGFYGTVLGGATQQEPRYRRVINSCMRLLPEPTGRVFTDAYFSEGAKAAIYDLVDHIKSALRSRIARLDWMSPQTKARANEKLDTFQALLGYPDTWRSYDGLELGDTYAANTIAIRAFEFRYDMLRLPKPVDCKEWLMSPAMVNAYYWSNTNTITFPAGILQPPFFDPDGDFAANYGGIGMVIGHEITHGFDDKGSLYDAVGNLHSWWTDEDRAKFDARTKALTKQYDAYMVDGRHVNGSLTLGENIADLGGALIAYDALQQKVAESGNSETVAGFTPQQRFFIALARIWRMNIRPELALQFLLTDPHAPNHLRINGTLVNVDAFYDAFNIPNDAAQYVSPQKRIRIW
ncbi:MAG TPA: M13 family metallopeptidase [Candidatus Saccharimonadales bacterium]|nr:M13 family metallopeptidase [Candidatus Saccharimonadales bacterium]